MDKNLPVYKLEISEDLNSEQEVNAVALVDIPAIGEGFFAFKMEPSEGETQDDYLKRCIPEMINEGKDQEQAAAICYSKWENMGMAFAVINEEERIVVGPAMIPNKLIYRNEKDSAGNIISEYNVMFTPETIQKIAQKFFEKNFQKNGNEMHDPEKPVDMVFYMSWIADSKKGIPNMEQFKDLPDGTWYLGSKIKSDESWQKVKDGTFRGLSVQGFFDMVQIKMSTTPENILEQIKQLLKSV